MKTLAEKENPEMKKLCALFLALYLLVGSACNLCFTESEEPSVYIQYVIYDGFSLEGRADLVDDVFFARISFVLRCGGGFVAIVPISREGLFQLDIACDCVYAAVDIVDSPCALVPGRGIVYASTEVELLPP